VLSRIGSGGSPGFWGGLVTGAAIVISAGQTPIFGQLYLVPSGFDNYGPGSYIDYGGATYQIGDGGTMALSAGASGPVYGQAYTVPAEYADTPAGSGLRYNGYDYVVGAGGTMTVYAPAPQQPDVAGEVAAPVTGSDPEVTLGDQAAGGIPAPVVGQAYAIPAEYTAEAVAGDIITYYGYEYVVNNDGTMTYEPTP